MWAQMQRGSKAEELSPVCKTFNPIGNRSYTKKASKSRQPNMQGAGKKPQIKNKLVTRGSQTRDNTSTPSYQNTKTIWKGIHSGIGLNTLGNKAQVNHVSNQLGGKQRGDVKQTTSLGKTALSN